MRFGVFGFQQTDRDRIDKTVVKDCERIIYEVGEYRSDDWERYQATVKEGERWLDIHHPGWRYITVP